MMDLLFRVFLKHYLEDLKLGRKPKNFIVFCRGNGVLGVDQLSVHHEPCQPNTSNMHANSERKLIPAMTFILKPYLYQETKNPDTIKILIRIQRQFLRSVAKSKGDQAAFLKLLKLSEDPEEEEREGVEEIVEKAVLEFGEWVGYGDLLTVKMIQEARMFTVGSAVSNSWAPSEFRCYT